MKKLIVTFIILCLTIFLITGCGGIVPGEGEGEGEGEDEIQQRLYW